MLTGQRRKLRKNRQFRKVYNFVESRFQPQSIFNFLKKSKPKKDEIDETANFLDKEENREHF